MNEMDKTVYIIDDDLELCEAMRWMLESVKLKVKVYRSAIDFLKEYSLNWEGCLLIDIRMPEISGLQLQQKLISLGNQLPIIIISGHGDINTAVRALKAGALDFVTKPFDDETLIEKIQTALLINKNPYNKLPIVKRYNALSPREQEITKYIVEGKMNKQVAFDLNISIKTVESHRANIMEKMGAKSFAELVGMYVQFLNG